MADIIYFGTHGSAGHSPKGIDKELTTEEYHYWQSIDNDRWIGFITKYPGFGHLTDNGKIDCTFYAFPWSIDDHRGGSHTDLFWKGDHTEEDMLNLIKENPFLARQFKMT